MLRHTRRILLELLVEIRRSERLHQFYSRALGWTVATLLLAGIVLVVAVTSGHQSRQPACRVEAQDELITVEPMALELAREPADIVQLLGGDRIGSPGLAPAVCVEERVARYRDALGMDSALFIPLYTLLGTMVLGWLLVVRLQASKAALQFLPKPRYSLALAFLTMAVMLLTAALDALENRNAHHVLDLVVGQGAFLADGAPSLGTAVDAMRKASLQKWLAAGAWMGLMAGMAWWFRPLLALAAVAQAFNRWPRWLSNWLVTIGLCTALALVSGALLGWVGPTSTSANEWVRTLLRAGFGLNFAFPFVVVALQVSHVRSTRMERANGEAKKIQCN